MRPNPRVKTRRARRRRVRVPRELKAHDAIMHASVASGAVAAAARRASFRNSVDNSMASLRRPKRVATSARRRRSSTPRAHHGPMTNLQFTPDSALAGGLILGSMVVAKRLNSGRNVGVSGDTKAFARGEGLSLIHI